MSQYTNWLLTKHLNVDNTYQRYFINQKIFIKAKIHAYKYIPTSIKKVPWPFQAIYLKKKFGTHLTYMKSTTIFLFRNVSGLTICQELTFMWSLHLEKGKKQKSQMTYYSTFFNRLSSSMFSIWHQFIEQFSWCKSKIL